MKKSRKNIIIFLAALLLLVAVTTVSACSCSDEPFALSEVVFNRPESVLSSDLTTGAAVGDNYILSVRNKQLGLFSKNGGGLDKVDFYDTGRAAPDNLYAYGDNFFALTFTETAVELRMYRASSAGDVFEPARTLVFSGEFYSAGTVGSKMYLTTFFSERYASVGNASVYTDNGQEKEIIKRSADGYDYRGFIVAEIDMPLCAAARSPVYFCGLSPKKLDIGENYIYARFGAYKRDGETVKIDTNIHALYNKVDFEPVCTVTDANVIYAVDGARGRLALMSVTETVSSKATRTRYTYKVNVYEASKKLGSFEYKTATFKTTVYDSRYCGYILSGDELFVRMPGESDALVSASVDFSDVKKIKRDESTPQTLSAPEGAAYSSGRGENFIVYSGISYNRYTPTAFYDFRQHKYINFGAAAKAASYASAYVYDDGWLYFSDKNGFYVYKLESGVLQLQCHMKTSDLTAVLDGVSGDSGDAEIIRHGSEFRFFYRGAAGCYDGGEAVMTDLRNMFTVSFDTGGGTEVPPILLEKGGKVTTETLRQTQSRKDGYTFVRWALVSGTRLYNINSDITLKAVWAEEEQ